MIIYKTNDIIIFNSF